MLEVERCRVLGFRHLNNGKEIGPRRRMYEHYIYPNWPDVFSAANWESKFGGALKYSPALFLVFFVAFHRQRHLFDA
ncbi:hypothetical protein L218DRAFT_952934 [Marasmius fiardii PR-910]|nr:hypothetical protein L218DRAFT_952934 [Marasmius fiardii PR-910]